MFTFSVELQHNVYFMLLEVFVLFREHHRFWVWKDKVFTSVCVSLLAKYLRKLVSFTNIDLKVNVVVAESLSTKIYQGNYSVFFDGFLSLCLDDYTWKCTVVGINQSNIYHFSVIFSIWKTFFGLYFSRVTSRHREVVTSVITITPARAMFPTPTLQLLHTPMGKHHWRSSNKLFTPWHRCKFNFSELNLNKRF